MWAAWSSYSTSYLLFSASSSWLLVKQVFLVYKMGIIMRGSNEVTYLGVHGIFHVQFGMMDVMTIMDEEIEKS